jgi:FecR protein
VGSLFRLLARRRVVAPVLVGAILVGLVLTMAVQSMAAQDHAVLNVFLGSVQVERAGASGYQAARSGELIASGDRVRTGADTKASLSFPDGSVTRLDSDTDLEVVGLNRLSAGGEATQLQQSSGQAWYTVVKLVGAASFRVDAPNNTTAEVRGTEFTIKIAGASGSQLVTAQVWAGEVDTSAAGRTLTLVAGQSTTISPGSPPTPATSLGPADRQDPWTVFNLGLDALAGGTITTIDGGQMSTGDSTQPAVGAQASAGDDLQFVLAWPGSTFQLTVLAPDGTTYAAPSSSAPPLNVTVKGADAGKWSYSVADLESQPGEQWYLFVARRPAPPATATPTETPTSDAGGTSVTVATPSPSPSTDLSSSPSTSSTPTPSAGPEASPTPTPVAVPDSTPTPTEAPTPAPTAAPTAAPTPVPTATPTPAPTVHIVVGPALLTTPIATLNQNWTFHPTASGGVSPYRWAVVGAPAWLTVLNAQSGEIGGKPTGTGVINFVVIATDANGATGSQGYVLTVIP